MDEDTPDIAVVLIINIIVYIVIPLVMAYRRGYLFNISEHFNWIKAYSKRKLSYLPTEWTLICVRQLSAFEKHQIQRIIVKLMPYDRTGYRTVIILKSGKTIEYPLGDNKGYWIDTEIPKDNILLRRWQKGTQNKYDIIPIVAHEKFG